MGLGGDILHFQVKGKVGKGRQLLLITLRRDDILAYWRAPVASSFAPKLALIVTLASYRQAAEAKGVGGCSGTCYSGTPDSRQANKLRLQCVQNLRPEFILPAFIVAASPVRTSLRVTMNVVAWITGRRREQSATRQQMPILELDSEGRLKINPLANWTRKEVWNYTLKHQAPYNRLHDQGYASIGDEPLKTPVQAGEHERAGRWRGTVKTECGIHV